MSNDNYFPPLGKTWLEEFTKYGFQVIDNLEDGWFSEKRRIGTYGSKDVYQFPDGRKELCINWRKEKSSHDIGQKLVADILKSELWKIIQIQSKLNMTIHSFQRPNAVEILDIEIWVLENDKKNYKFMFYLNEDAKKCFLNRETIQHESEEVYLGDGVYISQDAFDSWDD